jgi:hypothetical protein
MTKKSEIEKDNWGDVPEMSPGLETYSAPQSSRDGVSFGRAVNPRQSSDKRYERSFETESVADGNEPGSRPGASASGRAKDYKAYTIKLPSDQLSALQSIWLELKKLYGSHSPDKSGMIEAAIAAWLKRWDGPEHDKLLEELLDIRKSTRQRQYGKGRD